MNDLETYPVHPYSRVPLLLFVLVSTLTLLFSPVAAGGVSIEAGAVHACADGCSCMPATQAGQLGYIACSNNQTPCFHDSMERPLYCYKPSLGTCSTDCDTPLYPQPALNTTGTSRQDSTINTSGMPSDEGGMSKAAGEPDIFTSLIRFIRSLFGL